MGNRINSILKRFFDYPIKRKPICFYRQEDFTSTGEPLPETNKVEKGPPTEYDKLLSTFYNRLLSQRKLSKEMQERNRLWSVDKVIRRFPGWNEITIANLHSLFLLFDNNLNGMLSFEDFAAVIESLGDESSMERRKEQFDNADQDKNGFISYDEYLNLIYRYDPPDEEQGLTGLPKLCFDVAENIQFVSSLSVGEQLEYGLF